MSTLQKPLTIFICGECNLDCIYCYSAGEKILGSIDIQFARIGIQDFFSHEKPQLRLVGVGEATLDFDKMVEVVDYAKSIAGSSLELELQSNGFFPAYVGDWIENNVDVLWLSCDGPPDIHDAYRRTKEGDPSSSVVIENIRHFSRSTSCRLGVRATITNQTSKRQTEIVEYFHSLGVKHICADPIFLPVGNCCDNSSVVRSLLVNDPKEYGEDFIRAWLKAKHLRISFDSILTANARTRSCYGCQGCFTNPFLTVDGAITCCEMAFSMNTPLKDLIWGRFDADSNRIIYYRDAIDRIMRRRVENLSICSGCVWKYECSGGCLGEVLNEFKDMFGIKDFNCEATRYILPRIDRSTASPLGHS